MIEDTSFVIDCLRGDSAAVARLSEIEEQNIPEKLSSITVLELFEGIYQMKEVSEEHKTILDILQSKHIVSADGDVMKRAGTLSGKLVRRGEQIDREDCIIAATALQEGESVLTRNTSHFQRIEGLQVETY